MYFPEWLTQVNFKFVRLKIQPEFLRFISKKCFVRQLNINFYRLCSAQMNLVFFSIFRRPREPIYGLTQTKLSQHIFTGFSILKLEEDSQVLLIFRLIRFVFRAFSREWLFCSQINIRVLSTVDNEWGARKWSPGGWRGPLPTLPHLPP